MFNALSLSFLSFKIDFISFSIHDLKKDKTSDIQIITFYLFHFSLSKSILSLSLFTILKERILFLKSIFCPSVFTGRFQNTFFYHIIQLFPQFLITNLISNSLLNIP